MAIVRLMLWILIASVVVLISEVLIGILMSFFAQGDTANIGYLLRMIGFVVVVPSAIIVFLRLGLRLKSLDKIDVALITAFAIGVTLVVHS